MSRVARALSATLLLGSLFASGNAMSGTRVAFVGDQGVSNNARAVLSMIRDEGVDLVYILGDLGYFDNTAARWEDNLNEALGADFPVLTIVGNHDNDEWPLYRHFIESRVERVAALDCDGTVGVKAHCRFGNVDFLQTSPGIHEVDGIDGNDDYAGYIRSKFPPGSDSGGRWRICSWHKNQNAMQTGSKTDATGWDVFDACLDAGAIVAMGHEHAYSRTYLLSDFRNQDVVHRDPDMVVKPGQSIAFVSGLGGHDIRAQVTHGDWWASIYTASQGATHGALFCDFGASEAECAFKAIDGAVPDRFTLRLPGSAGSADIATAVPTLTEASPLPPQLDTPTQRELDGSVFERTDKAAFRWIARDGDGTMSSVWIDEACARQLGGATLRGDWDDLRTLAPAFDTISNPCHTDVAQTSNATASAPAASDALPDDGFVFARTDRPEFRWIAPDASGQLASVWLDPDCVGPLGGATLSGTWQDLRSVAPGFDTIESPGCAPDAGSHSGVDGGYVFSRTDKNEYRWIAMNASGQPGSIWIDEACAASLGGVSVTGDWKDLMTQAPGFDTVAYPCR